MWLVMRKYANASIITGLLLIGFVGVLYRFYFSPGSSRSRFQQMESFESTGVPSFQGKQLNGELFDLASYKGKVLIINFWASWCGPCVEEMPSLGLLVREFPSDVVLVAVSADSQKKDVEIFLKGYPEIFSKNIFVILDSQADIMRLYGGDRLPESFVVGRDFKLKKKVIGSIDWHSKEAVEYIRSLVNSSL